ncbi:Nucleic acid-binding, OB-fold [Sesbania bispinosa]|nr:Nucleic acid-binding, OB-fold [Sesbania bispinosa]
MSTMSAFPNIFISVKDVTPYVRGWVLPVQVIRIWSIPYSKERTRVLSVELVLTDAQGDKIQASLSRDVLKLRRLSMEEDGLYDISRAIVVPNEGKDRPTSYRLRLVFDMSTQIVKRTGRTYASLGLTPMSCIDIARKSDTDFLMDKVGLLTSLSPEREYIKGQRDTTVAFLEITDPTGIIECVLYDEYIDEVRDGGIESVVGVTRVLLYPEIPEPGMYVVWGRIIVLHESESWWNSSCNHQPATLQQQSMFTCDLCYSVVPRFNLKLEVSDGIGLTYIVLLDEDVERLVNASCKELLSSQDGSTSQSYPPIFQRLIGKAMLFLVEKKPGINHLNEGCFIAKRLCAEPEIVRMFLRGEFFRIDRQTRSTIGKFLGKCLGSTACYGGASSSGSGNNVNETHPSNPGQEVADPIDKECLVFSDGNS